MVDNPYKISDPEVPCRHCSGLHQDATRQSVSSLRSDAEVEHLTTDDEALYYHFAEPDRPLPPIPGDIETYYISWMGESDPDLPYNWSMAKRGAVLMLCAISALSTAFGSAVIGPGTDDLQKEFGVGLPVATLNVSLYVLGFALGPLVWGPLSEIVGRKLPVMIGLLGLTVLAFACGSAANFQTLVLCRFFAGVFGSSTMAVALAAMSDMFPSTQRGRAVALISLMFFAGPMVGPIVGGYISASFLGWRWTEYIWGILSALALLLNLLYPETYPPKILAMRAKKVRHKTGNWAVCAPLENLEYTGRNLLEKTVLKPSRMLVMEPILLLVSLYHGFINGILYLCLEAVPLIFSDYGWHGGNVYLPYLGMVIGAILGTAAGMFIAEPIFRKKLAASSYPVIPEERLPIMMACGIVFSGGIFLMCWSGAYFVHWIVPTIGCSLIGFGLVGIFLAALNYIIDTYLSLAASALAANTFTRSIFGSAFPLFVHPLFRNLGTQWAGTLLGCLAAALVPIPFLFYFFGAYIRSKSRFAASFETGKQKPN